jgi:hypothetical protein
MDGIRVYARFLDTPRHIYPETPLLMSLTRFVTRHALTSCQPTLRHQNEARETVGLDLTLQRIRRRRTFKDVQISTLVHGVLRVLAADLDPERIRPKRIYRRNRYFARNELSRLCLGVLRTAAGELLSTDDIANQVIAAKGFDQADAILCAAIREQVGSTVKRLHREGTITNIGAGRASKWKVAGG